MTASYIFVHLLSLLRLVCFNSLFNCSGTLSYIFNNFEGARTFSDVVAEAKKAGYTEPDPRDDLSGTDVARKVLIIFY
jgi:homoserine dehydrogenase